MKVGLVTPYDLAVPGGVNSHVFNLAHELDRQQMEVVVIGPTSSRHIPVACRVVPIGGATPIPSAGSVARLCTNPFVGRQIKRVLKREAFDVLHLHEPFIPVVPYGCLLFSKTANVGTFHLYRERPNLFYLTLSPMLRLLGRKLDARIAVSDAARRSVSQFLGGEYEVIPNGIDYERFAGGARQTGEAPTILFVGRIERRKGLEELIGAFALVKERFPAARLMVGGEGPGRERAQHLADSRGLHDVHFLGYVDPDRLPSLYRSSDVFCAPSIKNESFGIVLLEAMAAGTPVVASDISGYRAVLGDGDTGLLVPPRDSGALADAICRVLHDRDLGAGLAERGRAHAQAFAWPSIAGRVIRTYDAAIEAARGARRLTARSFEPNAPYE